MIKNGRPVAKKGGVLFSLLLVLCCRETEKFFEPAFHFPELRGNKIGKIFQLKEISKDVDHLILNFFAPDCPPCIEELPELEKFYLETSSKRKDVLFLGIASTLDSIANEPDSQRNSFESLIAPISKFRVKNRLKYKVYLADTRILRSFRITGFPETMIFKKEDGSFKLVRKFVSVIKIDDIRKYIDKPLDRADDRQNNNYN